MSKTKPFGANRCPNCGEYGPHFVPPSFGDKGFFICEKKDLKDGKEEIMFKHGATNLICSVCGKPFLFDDTLSSDAPMCDECAEAEWQKSKKHNQPLKMDGLNCKLLERCKYCNKWGRCYPDCLDYQPRHLA